MEMVARGETPPDVQDINDKPEPPAEPIAFKGSKDMPPKVPLIFFSSPFSEEFGSFSRGNEEEPLSSPAGQRKMRQHVPHHHRQRQYNTEKFLFEQKVDTYRLLCS